MGMPPDAAVGLGLPGVAGYLAYLTAGASRRLRATGPAPGAARASAQSRPRVTRLAPGAALAIALTACWLGQRSLAGPDFDAAGLTLYGLGLAVIIALDRNAAHRSESAAPGHGLLETATSIPPSAWRPRRWLLGVATLAAAYGWAQMQTRRDGASFVDVVSAWILALFCLALAAGGPPRLPGSQAWRRWRPLAPEGVLVAGIVLGALLIRAIGLDQIPYAVGGDEASQAMSSVSFLSGQSTNPFGTGWGGLPTFYFFIQAAWMRVLGDDVVGARSLSALFGAATVLLTYALARRFFGRPTAVLAALLLAAFHFHIHFSRVSEVNAADPLWLVATLFFIDRGLTESRRLDCALAGVTAGLSQYFYPSGRLTLPLAALYVAFCLMAAQRRRGETVELKPLAPLRLVGWMVATAVVTALPLATYYSLHPGDFSARINQVSAFGGWLDREEAITGLGPTEILSRQIAKGLWVPFHTRTSPIHFYPVDPPFLGMPLAVLTAIGLVLAMARLRDRRYFALAATWWVTLVGLGLTEDPTQTQRIVLIAPLVALLSAIALAGLGRILSSLLALRHGLVVAFGSLVLMIAVGWSLNYEFRVAARGPNQSGAGDPLVVTELAYYLRSLGQPVTVYFLGAPRMTYSTFATLPFIARQARGLDVNRPLGPDSAVLSVNGLTVFAAFPERATELRVVQGWYPGGPTVDLHDDSGVVVASVYEVRPR